MRSVSVSHCVVRVALLTALLALSACPPANQGGGQYGSGTNYGGRGNYGGSGNQGGSGNNTPVLVNLQRLPDAVVETSTSGVPRNNVTNLRRIYCEERSGDPVIFFQLVVSTHWHYYWICSDRRPHRASTPEGASRLRKWLTGFRMQASTESAGCSSARHTPILQGTHESGTRAIAYCDGKLVFNFPDGGRSNKTYTSRARGGGYSQPRPNYNTSGGTCPACPAQRRCPTVGSRQCPDCPKCPPRRVCPPCRCPKPPPCPKLDCTKQQLAAGRKGFSQGVRKACKRICTKIYKFCRKLNPKTSLCYQTSEYCAKNCAK